MPIQLPDLAGRTFDDLMKEMVASIPKFTREWTNLNPSDPGIAVLELLVWIAETLMYRADRVPEKSYMNFLRLISGPGEGQDDVYDPTDKAHIRMLKYVSALERGGTRDLQTMKAEAQRFLNSRYRLVTVEDFRALTAEADSEIARVEVFPLQTGVHVVIVPREKTIYSDPQRAAALLKKTRDYLEPRRLVASAFDVSLAELVPIRLSLVVVCKSYAKSRVFGGSVAFTPLDKISADTVEGSIAGAFFTYLDSLRGGPEGTGWQYGRNLMVYELFNIVESVEGVKYVRKITDRSGEPFAEIEVKGLISVESITISIEEESSA
jgi:hypothetical protein